MLSLVALPLIVANVREGLQAIPGHVREASYAVGKTKVATTRRDPAAGGAAVGRDRRDARRSAAIIGDTAIIVLLLGATLRFNAVGDVPLLGTLRGTGSTLTTYVYQNAPTGEGNQPTKAYAAAFVLLIDRAAAQRRRRRRRAAREGSRDGTEAAARPPAAARAAAARRASNRRRRCRRPRRGVHRRAAAPTRRPRRSPIDRMQRRGRCRSPTGRSSPSTTSRCRSARARCWR